VTFDTSRPLRADAQRNRARVLEAARTVLASEGLSAPIDRIAEEAGVGVGTIYRHFPTKEALYEAVVLQALAEFTAYGTSLATAADPEAAFFALLGRIIDGALSAKAVADALGSTGVDIKERFSDALTQLEQATSTLLRRAQRTGAVRNDVRAWEVIALITAGCIAAELVEPQRQQQVLTVILDGLRTTTKPARG
jgi:AcrR family transcriptional regulator